MFPDVRRRIRPEPEPEPNSVTDDSCSIALHVDDVREVASLVWYELQCANVSN